MPPLSEPALALFLLQQQLGPADASSPSCAAPGRLERIGRLAAALADGVEVIVLPAQDVLPYDFVPPSPAVIGRRVKALTDLARAPTAPRLLLTSATAALQRVRPAIVWQEATVTLHVGDELDPDGLRAALAQRAYHWDERVDEPGDVAIRGQVIDVFPAGGHMPARLHLQDGRITAIGSVDPVTLRTTTPVDSIELRPATEYRIDADEMTEARALIEPGADTAAHKADSICHAASSPCSTSSTARPATAIRRLTSAGSPFATASTTLTTPRARPVASPGSPTCRRPSACS